MCTYTLNVCSHTGSYCCLLLGVFSLVGLKGQLSVYIHMVICRVHLVASVLCMNDQAEEEDKASENLRQVPMFYSTISYD